MHTAMKLLKGAYRRGCLLLLCLIVWLFAVGLYHTVKPLPDGITVYGREWRVPEDRVRFLFDLTYENRDRDIVSEQEIFDTAFAVIENARRYILIDMFLFNSRMARVSGAHRNLAGELTALLIEKKRRYPLIVIDLITDDINTVYGGAPSPELTSLSEAGVNVVITNHKPLRDSNPIYSSVWRTCFQWFGNADSGGIFPHPFSQSGERVTLRSYLALLNFKANHRKVIVADDGDTLTGLIISANCHDASSAHSNVGIMMSGDIWREVYDSENAIAALSGKRLEDIIPRTNDSTSAPPDESFLTVRVLSEQAIKTELLRLLGETGRGDSLSMAMFYLTEREVMRSLLDAAERGAVVRIILDPSKDAFGYDKHGIPNRQAAAELVRKSGQAIKIRWQNTHGEQFHAKLVSVRKTDGTSALLLGSANLTRRNIRGYNLELDVRISGSSDAACMERTSSFFERLWSNEAGDPYTLDYEAYEDTSLLKTMLYRVYEYAGLSTF